MTGKRTVTIAEDDRGRVPFALIGVLLLATSATAVGMLATRPENPGVDTDPSVVVDQTKGSIQPAVRESTREALSDAAKEPVTDPSDTFAGRALEVPDPDTDLFEDEYAEDWVVFKRYAKLRIYLRARENLALTSHSYQDRMRTSVSLPDVNTTEESVESAIDRVTLETGVEDDDLEPGTVRATIDDVEITVYRNGDVIDRQTTSITVSVPSTAFVSHRKVVEYEKRLNRDFDPTKGLTDGLGNRLGWRLYLLTYFKEYHDRLTPISDDAWTGKKVMPTKEIEILANDGIKNVQQGTFGMKDPELDRIMLGKYVCLLSKVGEKLANAHWKPPDRVKRIVNSGNVCTVADLLTNDALTQRVGTARAIVSSLYEDAADIEKKTHEFKEEFGSWNSVGNVVSLLKEDTGTSTSRGMTVDVDKYAEDVYDDFTGDGADDDFEDALGDSECSPNSTSCSAENVSENAEDARDGEDRDSKFEAATDVDAVIDDVYRVDTWGEMDRIEKTGSINRIDPSPEPAENWTREYENDVVADSEVTVEVEERWRDGGPADRPIYEVSVTYEHDVYEEEKWTCTVAAEHCGGDSEKTFTSDTATITYETTVYVVGDYHLQDDVDRRAMRADYVESSPTFGTATNLKPAVDDAVEHVFGEPPGSVEGEIENSLEGSKVLSKSTFEGKLGVENVGESNNETVSVEPADREALKSWLTDRLRETVEEIKDNDTVSPLNMSSTEFASADEVFPRLKEQIDTRSLAYGGIDDGPYRDAPQKALVKLRIEYVQNLKQFLDQAEQERLETTEEISEQTDTDARGSLKFAQSALDSGGEVEYTDGSIPSPSLLGDVKYSLEVAPTYLGKQPVSQVTEPAVGPGYQSPENQDNTLHAGLAISNYQEIREPGIPLIPWPSYWYLSANYWDVSVKGEYARVKVTGTAADTATPQSLTYVRQEQPVRLEFDGDDHTVGNVEPVDFSTGVPVVGIIPGLIPPPNNGVPLIGRGATRPNDLCSPTWDYTGPEFSPALASCGAAGGGGGTSTVLDAVKDGGSLEGFIAELVDEEFEEELEDRSEPDEICNEERFLSVLPDSGEEPTATEWYEAQDEGIQEDIVDQFCRVLRHPTLDAGLYARLLGDNGEDDDRIPESWRETVLEHRADTDAVFRALTRVEWVNDNGHDLKRFMDAGEVNAEAHDGKPPHEQPGIVVAFETQSRETDTFERVYDPDDGPAGPWIAPEWVLDDFETKSQLVDRLALLDESVVEPDGAAWADYRCIADVTVPEGTVLWMSTTNGFEEGEPVGDSGTLERTVPGDVAQVYAPPVRDTSYRDEGAGGGRYQLVEDHFEPDRPVPGVDVDAERCGGEADPELEIHVIDVGKGASVLAEGPGDSDNVLVDPAPGALTTMAATS